MYFPLLIIIYLLLTNQTPQVNEQILFLFFLLPKPLEVFFRALPRNREGKIRQQPPPKTKKEGGEDAEKIFATDTTYVLLEAKLRRKKNSQVQRSSLPRKIIQEGEEGSRGKSRFCAAIAKYVTKLVVVTQVTQRKISCGKAQFRLADSFTYSRRKLFNYVDLLLSKFFSTLSLSVCPLECPPRTPRTAPPPAQRIRPQES